jgi:mannose-6-phosphate isomerase
MLSGRDAESTLGQFFSAILEMNTTRSAVILEEALGQAAALKQEADHFRWMIALSQKYPGDLGILSPVLLNCLCLEPGQALFLPAGELHAYLDGTAIELMANSDNVLRGGLTPKHIDPQELLRVLNFDPRPPRILLPQRLNSHESRYPTWAEEFQLSHIQLDEGQNYTGSPPQSAEILLCVEGRARIEIPMTAENLEVPSGKSVFVSAASPAYRVSGKTRLYKAGIPSPDDVR